MFGKLGRACTGPLRTRQYSQSADCTLSPALTYSLKLMQQLVQHAPSRAFLLEDSRPPLILYTDASDVPDRIDGRAILGAVLLDPLLDFEILYTYWVVPDEILHRMCPRQTYMFPLEIMAGPLAMMTWKERMSDRHLLPFHWQWRSRILFGARLLTLCRLCSVGSWVLAPYSRCKGVCLHRPSRV